MQVNPGESTLYSCRPQQAIYLGIIYSVIVLFLLRVSFEHNETDWFRFIYIIISVGFSIHYLTLKFILTDQRCCMHSLLFKSETQLSSLTTPVYLQLPPNHTAILKLYRLLRMYKAENHIMFWQKRALLRFNNHSPTRSSFFHQTLRSPLTLLNMSQFSEEQSREILLNLKYHWQLNPETFNENPSTEELELLKKSRQEQDIGYSPLLISAVALLIGFAAMLVSPMVLQGLHFAVEAWNLMIPFIIVSILLSWLIIRIEGKKYPFFSALLSGCLLGPCLYFGALQLNRIYSEHNAAIVKTQMYLNSVDQHSQQWSLSPELAETSGLNDIYVHKDWQWYRSDLKTGQKYTIQLKQGYFQDYFIDQDSFRLIPEQ